MTPYRPAAGTIEIDRIIPPVGRVRLRTGTHDLRRAQQYDRMLDVLPLDVVRLLQARHVTLREVFDLWSRGQPLPSADELRPLIKTLDAWLEKPLRPVSAAEQKQRDAFGAKIRALAPAKSGMRAFPALCRHLYEGYDAKGQGAGWNRTRAAALAFVRDTLGRRSDIYRAVVELPALKEVPKYPRHPCTVGEAKAIAQALGPKWGPVWWALCCTGMEPKEYWIDGWRVIGQGIEINGQKRDARNRVVPLVVRPPDPPGKKGGFSQAMKRAKLGVTPLDARRSYARWLDEIGAPDYLQDAFKGHGPKTMRALYKWGSISAWLAEYERKLRQYVGEAPAALELAR